MGSVADSRRVRRVQGEREVAAAVSWFFATRYQADHGPGTLPFYCDPNRVGAFAVEPAALGRGDEAALFRLFVTLSMYQGLRDVVVMGRQRALPRSVARVVTDLGLVGRSIATHGCSALKSVQAFEEGCDVLKSGGAVDCRRLPGEPCHVKDATAAFDRMGDMGMLPTSAWMRLWEDGIGDVLRAVCRAGTSPKRRAELLVARFAEVHRVGRKLATMFVSALSMPALAPGLSPWFPAIDGNELVVVDTNVAQVADALRRAGSPKTYDARAQWVRRQARNVNLQRFDTTLPPYSPRLVQEALYAFRSRSNRAARGDPCAARERPCIGCADHLCPFAS